MVEKTSQAFHNDVLQYFNEQLYDGIFTKAHLSTKEQEYKFKRYGEKMGYRLSKEGVQHDYFIESKDISKLPLKIITTVKDSFRTDVLYIVKEAESITIPSKECMSFRELVDSFCDFEHSEPEDWFYYKFITLVAWIDRINYRIATEPGFGKDSAVDIIKYLVNDTANIYGATEAKIKYLLNKRFLLLNEMADLSKDDQEQLTNFMFQAGGFKNQYMNKSRKTGGTKEEFDIKELSIGVVSNMDGDYKSKGKKTFNEMFTKAVINRFFPLMLKGHLIHNFKNNINVKAISKENDSLYKNLIATLNYWRDNRLDTEPIDYNYPNPFLQAKQEGRYRRSFETICKYLSHYASDRETYIQLVDGLYKKHTDYKDYLKKLNNQGMAQHIDFEDEMDFT